MNQRILRLLSIVVLFHAGVVSAIPLALAGGDSRNAHKDGLTADKSSEGQLVMMNNVYWRLGKKEYASYENFVNDVTEYNKKINDKHEWNSESVIDQSKSIKIVFEASWKDKDDTLELIVHSKNGHGVTMGELLFNLNNHSINFFRGADKCFFEGLTKLAKEQGTPVYRLRVGS